MSAATTSDCTPSWMTHLREIEKALEEYSKSKVELESKLKSTMSELEDMQRETDNLKERLEEEVTKRINAEYFAKVCHNEENTDETHMENHNITPGIEKFDPKGGTNISYDNDTVISLLDNDIQDHNGSEAQSTSPSLPGSDGDAQKKDRVLSSQKAAELERFKQEIHIKREARHRALAAVSSEMERLRTDLEKEKEDKQILETQLETYRQRSETSCEGNAESIRQELQKERDERILVEKELQELKGRNLIEENENLRVKLNKELLGHQDLKSEIEILKITESKNVIRVLDYENSIKKLQQELNTETEARKHVEAEFQSFKEEQKQKFRISLDEEALLNDVESLQSELDREREHSKYIVEEQKLLRAQLEEVEEEKTRLKEQVAALKEVVAIGKRIISIREAQVNHLETKLQGTTENSNSSSAVAAAAAELRAEYESQISNIRALRELYSERAKAQEAKTAEEKSAREQAQARVLELQEQLDNTSDNVKTLTQELSLINDVFAQMLAEEADLDTLTKQLQQNHDLISEITTAAASGKAAPGLPKLLLDLAINVNDDVEAAGNDEAGASAPAMTREEIALNLPKVWKVLTELLSHHQIPDEVSKSVEEGGKACYKSIDTPNGPRLVISVSKTFIRLKDLILEKNALQRELSRLTELNTHLETKVGRQQRRLSLVSSELRKTWGVVGRMQAQHRQLHTHEKILRYELQQKRNMLKELREELEHCREKWERAREKNSQSEAEWKELRKEFAARKKPGSGESGCYSDDGNERPAAPLESSELEPSLPDLLPLNDLSDSMPPLLDVEDLDPSLGSGSGEDDDECPTVSMVTKLKEQLAWFTRNLESVVTQGPDDVEALQSIFSLPAIQIPEHLYQKLATAEKRGFSNEKANCDTELPTLIQSTGSNCTTVSNTVNITNKVKQSNVYSHETPTVSLTGKSQNTGSSLNADSKATIVEPLKQLEATYSGSETEPQRPTRSPEQLLEARAARLQRLEEQCRQLVQRVTQTSHRSTELSNRLEELHGQYGTEDASPGGSPILQRRNRHLQGQADVEENSPSQSPSPPRRSRIPPIPPPIPETLPNIPVPPHLPSTLPAFRIPTTQTMERNEGTDQENNRNR